MPDDPRPIRIQIPSELGFSQNELDALEVAFRTRLIDVESNVNLDNVTPVESINTTRLAVDVEVIAPTPRQVARLQAAAEQAGAEQPGGQQAGGGSAGDAPETPEA